MRLIVLSKTHARRRRRIRLGTGRRFRSHEL